MTTLSLIIYFVALSFIIFGKSCLHKKYMKLEFERYGLSKFRVIVGILQLIGGLGLLLGLHYNLLLLKVSAFGLFILMVLGFLTRLKIKDGALKSAPALIYALLSLYIFYKSFSLSLLLT
ncbi:DoxX family protein [Winogradskyella wandonensis]|nr:DoxX family protein [Winogradskyella wandonensis]